MTDLLKHVGKQLFSLVLIILGLSATTQGQNWQWARGNLGGGVDAWAVATDPGGNVIAAGMAYEGNTTYGSITVPFPPSLITYDEQAIIVKYDASGNVLWAFGAGTTTGGNSQPINIATDAAGNIFMLGVYSGSITFGSFTLTTPGTNDYFLAKISPSGTVLWANDVAENSAFYGQVGLALIISWGGVAVDNTGNVYITGNYNQTTAIGTFSIPYLSTSSGDNIFIAKYTTTGSVVWATSMGGTASDDAFSIVVASTGNVYITGAFTSPSITVGPSTITNSFATNIAYVAEFSSSGTPLWAEAAGGASGAYGAGLAADGAGNVYLTGAFGDPTITFGSVTFSQTYPAAGETEAYLIQLSSANVVTWNKTIGSPSTSIIGFCIALASCGQVWVSGAWPGLTSYSDSANIDGHILHMPDSSGDPVFMAGYNLTGGVVGYAALQSGADDQNGIACDATGNVFQCADFYNSGFTDFIVGPDTLYQDPSYSGSEFLYVAKYTNVIGAPDTIRSVTDTSFCNLVGAILQPPAGFYGPYLWSTGSTASSITLDSSGTYWVMCPGGCSTSYLIDTFHVNINSLDTLHNSKDTAMCSGNTMVLWAPAGYPTYLWNIASAGTASVSVSAAGTFWVACYDSCAMAPVIDTFHVTINQRDSSYQHTDTTLCAHTGLVFSAPAGYLFYQWSNGDTGQSITLSPSVGTDVLWVTCIDSCYLPYLLDTFSITIDSLNLSFSLGNDTFACGPVLLQIPESNVSYLWQNGSTDQDYTATETGTYYASVSKDGCKFSDTIQVDISYQYTYNFDTTVCLDEGFNISLNVSVPEGSTLIWNTGARQATIAVVDTGLYLAFLKDSVCTAVDSMHVTGQYCNCWAFIPNAFVPDGSVVKDKGFIPIIDPYCNPRQYTFSIFDRWGKLVFITTDPTVAWDGTYDGVPAALGVYMYECTFWGGLLNKKFYFKGDVTLVR